jgi:hypothetical protein
MYDEASGKDWIINATDASNNKSTAISGSSDDRVVNRGLCAGSTLAGNNVAILGCPSTQQLCAVLVPQGYSRPSDW